MPTPQGCVESGLVLSHSNSKERGVSVASWQQQEKKLLKKTGQTGTDPPPPPVAPRKPPLRDSSGIGLARSRAKVGRQGVFFWSFLVVFWSFLLVFARFALFCSFFARFCSFFARFLLVSARFCSRAFWQNLAKNWRKFGEISTKNEQRPPV